MDLRNWLKKGTLREDEQCEKTETNDTVAVDDDKIVTKRKKATAKSSSEGVPKVF
jgi:hypothetical protein